MRLKPQIVFLIKEFGEAFFAQKLRTKNMNIFFLNRLNIATLSGFFIRTKAEILIYI